MINRKIVSLSLLALLAACADSPAGPVSDLDAALDIATGEPVVDEPTRVGGRGEILDVLLRRAIRSVAESEGREAAHALLDPVLAELAAAREARAAGLREEAIAHLQAARLLKAEIVVDTLGTGVVDRVLNRLRSSLSALRERLAQSDRRPPPILRHVAALAEEAFAAHNSGENAVALEKASRALHLLEHAFDRRTDRRD